MFFVEAVMRRFLKANFKKSIVFRYYRENPRNRNGYGDLFMGEKICLTNTP